MKNLFFIFCLVVFSISSFAQLSTVEDKELVHLAGIEAGIHPVKYLSGTVCLLEKQTPTFFAGKSTGQKAVKTYFFQKGAQEEPIRFWFRSGSPVRALVRSYTRGWQMLTDYSWPVVYKSVSVNGRKLEFVFEDNLFQQVVWNGKKHQACSLMQFYDPDQKVWSVNIEIVCAEGAIKLKARIKDHYGIITMP